MRKASLLGTAEAAKPAMNEIGSSFDFGLQSCRTGGGQLVGDIPAIIRVFRPRRESLLHHAVEHDAQGRGRKPIMRGKGLEIALPVESEGEKGPKPLLAHTPLRQGRELLSDVPFHGTEKLEKPARDLTVPGSPSWGAALHAFRCFQPSVLQPFGAVFSF